MFSYAYTGLWGLDIRLECLPQHHPIYINRFEKQDPPTYMYTYIPYKYISTCIFGICRYYLLYIIYVYFCFLSILRVFLLHPDNAKHSNCQLLGMGRFRHSVLHVAPEAQPRLWPSICNGWKQCPPSARDLLTVLGSIENQFSVPFQPHVWEQAAGETNQKPSRNHHRCSKKVPFLPWPLCGLCQ